MRERLKVENLSFSYGDRKILENINLSLGEGELVSLLGISGSGKTTLFSLIAGLLKPQSGRILLKGEDITASSGHISYMMQKDLLLPYRSIEDNVILPLLLKGTSQKNAREEVQGLFDTFGIPGTQKKYPAQLSGGMRQRAALLRTYLFSKEMALLDEPFSALDALTKEELHGWYMDMMEKLHMSVLFITHDIDEAILLSDRIYIMAGQPGGIRGEIRISEQKPRGNGFKLSERFLEIKRKILGELQ